MNHIWPLLLVSILWPYQVFSTPIKILVPAYANPCCDHGAAMWNSLIVAASNPNINISLIFNPASGPGTATDTNYIDAHGMGPLVDFRNAGGKVYGYVPTNYGSRSQLDVQADIDKYYDTIYSDQVDGIFFDEMSNDLANVGYYQTISSYVHAKDISDLVISNPGTSFTNNRSSLINFNVLDYANSADVLMTFENTSAEYFNNYTPPSWVNGFDADHFAHVIHTQADWNSDLVDLAIARNAGYVYFSDDVLPNPYEKLASYWDLQVSDIAVQNTAVVPVPGSFCLLITGLAFLGSRRKKRKALKV
jgi:phosphoribosyl-AMP cyclohydrolase